MNGEMIVQWLDLVWLPVVFFLVIPRMKWVAIGFVTACILMLRMQIEVLEEFGIAKEGIRGMLTSDPFHRGLATYSVIILLYVLLTVSSKRTMTEVYLAASITIFILAFTISSVLMIL